MRRMSHVASACVFGLPGSPAGKEVRENDHRILEEEVSMLTFEESDLTMTAPVAGHHPVLLVSRSGQLTLSLNDFFRDSDISLVSVGSCCDGIRRFKQEQFEAVITDLGLEPDDGIRLRQAVHQVDAKIPVLFLTSPSRWSDSSLMDLIAEDPHSYYIPENGDREFMLAKLHQVIHTYEAETSLSVLKGRVAKSWFLAGRVQQAMLPPWVHFSPNYEFSCLYHPFTKVSGDLFEWLPLDEDRALFIFGDVSGHGTHSALAMTAIQSFLSQLVMQDRERAEHPELIVADINDFCSRRLRSIVYMGTLVAYMDFGKNLLRYQNAGYVDVLCVDSRTGEVIDINPEGKGSIPLGLVPDAAYTAADTVEYHFEDSSVFLFSSDGLMDLSRDREGRKYMDMETYRHFSCVLAKDARRVEKTVALPFRCLHNLEQLGYIYPQDDLTMVMVRKPRLTSREYVFSCRVPADSKSADDICRRAGEFVQKYYGDESLSVSTELLLEEYLVNVIMHGLDAYEKLSEYIAVEIVAHDRELKLIVWDRGKEWDGLWLTRRHAEESMDHLNRTMADSGRGIPIISTIASRISRHRFCGLNETTFIIPRSGGAAGEGR